MGPILLKLKGSLGMFWQALDEEEQRTLIYVAVYIGLSVGSELTRRARARQVDQVKRAVIEELTQHV